MSWHYLPELVADCSGADSSGGAPSAPWKKSRTAGKCCSDASGTVCCPCSRSGTTSRRSKADPGVAWWMSSLRAFRVSHSPALGGGSVSTTNGTCGLKPSASFARFDRDSACWRTYQGSLFQGTSIEFSGTWPKAGLIAAGRAYRLRLSALRINGIVSGLLRGEERRNVPTPASSDWKGASRLGQRRGQLSEYVKFLVPTPTAMDAAGFCGKPDQGRTSPNSGRTLTGKVLEMEGMGPHVVSTPTATRRGQNLHRRMNTGGGSRTLSDDVASLGDRGELNPPWVEWLMGWPIGWTELEALGMGRFQQWLELHGCY